jgi:hypothetical protein
MKPTQLLLIPCQLPKIVDHATGRKLLRQIIVDLKSKFKKPSPSEKLGKLLNAQKPGMN